MASNDPPAFPERMMSMAEPGMLFMGSVYREWRTSFLSISFYLCPPPAFCLLCFSFCTACTFHNLASLQHCKRSFSRLPLFIVDATP